MEGLIICVFVVTLSTNVLCDKSEEFIKIHKDCKAETNLTEAELKILLQNVMKASDANDNVKCYIKCVLEKHGLLKGGVYDEAAAIADLKMNPFLKDHQAEIEKAVDMCKNEKGANDCDTAFKISMCISEQKLQMLEH